LRKKPACLTEKIKKKNSTCSSTSLSTAAAAASSDHGAGPLVDPFQSHTSRNLCYGPPWYLLPVGL